MLDAKFARKGPDAGGNKLRTYELFKESYTSGQYVRIIYVRIIIQNIDLGVQNADAV